MTVSYINWSNVTDLSTLPSLANTGTEGSFWVVILYMIWIILMLAIMVYGFEVSMLVSSFIALILGLLLVYAGLIAWTWILPFLAIIILLFLYITWNKNKT